MSGPKGSLAYSRWARELRMSDWGLKRTHGTLLRLMVTYVDADGRIEVGAKTLAATLEVTREYVHALQREIGRAGLLRKVRGGGGNRAAVWQCRLDAQPAVQMRLDMQTETVNSEVHSPGSGAPDEPPAGPTPSPHLHPQHAQVMDVLAALNGRKLVDEGSIASALLTVQGKPVDVVSVAHAVVSAETDPRDAYPHQSVTARMRAFLGAAERATQRDRGRAHLRAINGREPCRDADAAADAAWARAMGAAGA